MSILLDRWRNEIQPKINRTNSKNSVGPSPTPTTTTTPKSNYSTSSGLANYLTNASSKKGGSSGGSSGSKTTTTTKNSPYTAPTLGNTYDANTDYQTIINSAVENGDYYTAAKAEQLRNQKILGEGMNYDRTNTYGGYLDGTDIDLSIVGTNQMNNGASKDDVANTYWGRENKIYSSPELYKYANDPVQQAMYQYVYGDTAPEYEEFEYDEEQPTAPKTDPRIAQKLAEILNRDGFNYDLMNDPLYQQYAEMYLREGDRAMRETMAEAAASAGGMNTWAMTAANQANQYYNSQLNDLVPELYNLAYDKYLNEIELEVQDLGLLQDMDATQYNRYRDTMADWRDDRNFAYGVYQDAIQQGNWETEFNRNVLTDNRDYLNNNIWNNREWNNFIEQQALENKRYDQEYTDKKEQQALENSWVEREYADNKEQQKLANEWRQKEWDNYLSQQALENSWTAEELALQKSKFESEESWKDKEWLNYLEQQAFENGITQDELNLKKSQYNLANEKDAREWANYLEQQAFENNLAERQLTNSENQQQYNNEKSERDDARADVWTSIELGVMPDDATIKKAGMEDQKETLLLLVETVKKNLTESKSSGSKSGGKSTSQTEEEPQYNPNPKTSAEASYLNLGIGPVSKETILKLVEGGALELNDDGTVKWAKGYNADNYEDVLKRQNSLTPNLISSLF